MNENDKSEKIVLYSKWHSTIFFSINDLLCCFK